MMHVQDRSDLIRVSVEAFCHQDIAVKADLSDFNFTLSLSFTSLHLSMKAVRFASWLQMAYYSMSPQPIIRMSSAMGSFPFKPSRSSCCFFWYSYGATDKPKRISTADVNVSSFSLSRQPLASSSIIPRTVFCLTSLSLKVSYPHETDFSLSLVKTTSVVSPCSCFRLPKIYLSKMTFLVGLKYCLSISRIATMSFCWLKPTICL